MKRVLAALALALVACGGTRPSSVTLAAPAGTQRQVARAGEARVVFEGNHDVSRDDLLAVLHFPASGPYPEDVLERDVLLLHAAYYDRGYVDATVAPPTVEASADGADSIVRFRIQEGRRYRIGRIEVHEVDTDGAGASVGGSSLRGRMRARDGEWFNRQTLADDLEVIRRMHRDLGYPLVEVEPQVHLDRDRSIIDVTVPISRGPRVTLDHVVITGADDVPRAEVRRALDFPEGSLFSEGLLRTARERLLALGVFDDVAISTKGTATDPHWTLLVELTPRAR